MEVYLIRHTQPQVEKGVCYGQSDVLVKDSFQEEVNKLLKHLPKTIDTVYASPLMRCQKLAKELKASSSIQTDKRLMELNFGDWEMKKWDEIDQTELNKWMKDFVNVKVPNGESFTEMNTRVSSFAEELLKKEHKTAAVVAHAGVIRCLVALVLEIPLKNAFKIPVDHSSVTKINVGTDNCFGNIEYLNRV